MIKIYLSLLTIVLGMVSVLWAYVQHPKFGPSLGEIRSPRVLASPHYRDGAFRNQVATPLFAEGVGFFSVLWKGLTGPKVDNLRPSQGIPVIKRDLRALDPAQDTVVWLGHSSFFVQINGQRILIDPVFSPYAAPVSFAAQAFDGTMPYGVADMPAIDALLITHSHWDHLDYDSVTALAPKVRRVIAPLGVGAYFRLWGYADPLITEVDWNESVELAKGLSLHALPARHYTRRLMETNQTLWVSFALVSPHQKLFFSGDSGYGPHFTEIGHRFQGFDFVALDSGQYDERWPYIHMTPEQASQAALDLGAKTFLPAHIGRFALSQHAWDEPFNRQQKASAGQPYRLLLPMIGQPLALGLLGETMPPWWRLSSETGAFPMKIILTVEGQSLPITLGDTQAARDLVALLPLRLTLTDYGAIEKISDLPSSLSTAGAPRGMKPVAGDVSYYAPWGNLAIFLKEFSYSDGLVRLGHIEQGLEILQRKGPLSATLEREQ